MSEKLKKISVNLSTIFIAAMIALSNIGCGDNFNRDVEKDETVSKGADSDVQVEEEDISDDIEDRTDNTVQSEIESPDVDEVVSKYPENLSTKEISALDALFPNAARFLKGTSDGRNYYRAEDDKGVVIGYVFESSHRGFDGNIVNYLGMTPDGKSIALETVKQVESWWYRIGDAFFEQFKSMQIGKISLTPAYDDNCYYMGSNRCDDMYDLFGDYSVDSWSGATVSTDAMIKNVLDGFYSFDKLPSK